MDELNDLTTVQMVPTKVNSTFGHLGGISEASYDEEEMPINGKDALISFLDDIDKFPTVVGKGVLEYYQNRREELGYDIENNSDYPDFKDYDQILETLQLIGITVPDQDDYCERAIFLVFNCDWDKENGVGVCLIGDAVDEVGFQGIAL